MSRVAVSELGSSTDSSRVLSSQVLDEDAQDLVVKVWRVLAIETEYAAAGVDI